MKRKRKLLSWILTAAMCFSTVPTMAFAATDDTGLCEHHAEHTVDCGYSEGFAGVDCTHEHEDCYVSVTQCIHQHEDLCFETAEEGVEPEPSACTHECSMENGCITEVLSCSHEHDEACGYVPAVKGTPCTNECMICYVQELIDELPDAADITAENADSVGEQLSAVDAAKVNLTDEEMEQLDTAPYMAAVTVLSALAGQAGADKPAGISDGNQTKLDVSQGNIEIGDGTLDAYDADGMHLTTADPDGYIITGTTTSNTVRIIGGSHSVYVRELNINAKYAAFYIENAHVDLFLVADCTLDSGNGCYDLHLEGTNASVTINGNGTLYAGYIGGNNGGTITIENGGFNFDDVTTGNTGTVTIKGGIYLYGYPNENCVGMQKVPVAERYKVIEDPTRNWRYEVVHEGYNISFHVGDGGNGEMEAETGVSGSYTLPKCTFTPPAGKVFAGWSTTENGAVITERSITMDQDYTFYAQWVDISDAGIAIDETNFPDATFRSYVATNFDINQNGYLSDTDISAATEINVMGQSITSLMGVEYFTALTKLRCDTNQLTSLDISENKSLLELDCGANDLTSLDVSNNTLLTRLTCDANKLTSLDVRNNTQLGELECSYNELTALDVSKNTVLTYLGCNANELTTLDVSNNTGLVQLECSDNQLTSLDLSMNLQLSTLFCSRNAYLISVDADRTYDLTKLPGDFDDTKASNWTGGTVEGDVLTVEPNTTSVTYTYANGFNDSVIFTLNVLDVSNSGVLINETNFPDAVFREYITTQFDTNNDSSLSKEEIDAVTEISVTGKAIASLQGVEYFTALTKLVCDNCQLTSLDVSKNIALQKLSCVGNQLTSLDVSRNINLGQLMCSNNQLTSLNVKDDVLLICQGNSYAITVDSTNRTFDLTNLPGDFDATKASNWSGGTVEGNILTVNSGTSQITYIYACGGTYISQDNVVFTLDITEGSTYTVTLNANGGTGDDIVKTDIVGNYNLPVCTFTAPDGKQFKGWATSASGDVITAETINVTANTTLYAIWEDAPVTPPAPAVYGITVTNGSASVSEAEAGQTITITADTAPSDQRFKEWTGTDGLTFVEGTSNADATAKFTMPANAVSVTATYEVIPAVTVSSIAVNSNDHKTVYTVGDALDVTGLSILVTKSDNSTEIVNVTPDMVSGFDSASAAASQTLTITYEGKTTTYTVSINAVPVAAITGISITPATASVQKGNTQQFTATVTGTGDFVNTVSWTVEGGVTGTTISDTGLLTVAADETAETLTVQATANGDNTKSSTATVTVTAVPVTKYQVTVTGGTGSAEYEKDATVTITADVPEAGKQFKEWQVISGGVTLADATKVTTTFTMPANAVAVKAIYEDIPVVEYTVKFDAQGGSAVADQTTTGGKLTTLPTTSKAGYTFDGWFDAATGGNKIDTNTIFGSDTTLYAHWTKSSGGSGGSGGGGGGGSSSSSTTTTEKNDDGSTTTTTTNNKTGTVTETTENTDGSTVTVVTETDGTVTETVEKADGSKEIVETKADGTVITTVEQSNGVEVETVAEPNKDVTVSVTVPKDVEEAVVIIPVEDMKPGVVPVDAATGEVITESVPTEDGISVKLDGSAEIILVDNSKDFADTTGHWGESAIDFCSARGILNGKDRQSFSPDMDVTRGQIAQILHNIEGRPEGAVGHDFPDAVDHWAEDAIGWAAENNIISGYANGEFGTEDALTREQLATILYRYAGSPAAYGSLAKFVDDHAVSGYAEKAMIWAVEAGLISGVGDNTLDPQGTATRAQLASIIQRYMAMVLK